MIQGLNTLIHTYRGRVTELDNQRKITFDRTEKNLLKCQVKIYLELLKELNKIINLNK